KCTQCHGQMRVRQKGIVTVKIPGGVENGSTIRINGKGEAGIMGGNHGDLYLHLSIASHPRFQRQGNTIYSTITIHVLQAILGDEIQVETVHGKVKLKMPTGTQHGQIFKIKDHGVRSIRGQNQGDHQVKIQINIPGKVSRKEKELYHQLAKEAGLDIHGDEGLLSKIIK
ncbi:MAG: chaperone protein, molecular chaperone DnaJ, partial [Candidatus Peregrinibacteria bacterium GW2011_GWE2_39_6]